MVNEGKQAMVTYSIPLSQHVSHKVPYTGQFFIILPSFNSPPTT